MEIACPSKKKKKKKKKKKRLTLRDKFALEILRATCNGHDKEDANILNSFYHYFSKKQEDNVYQSGYEITARKFENLVRAAYKMADIMRKIRITAFE